MIARSQDSEHRTVIESSGVNPANDYAAGKRKGAGRCSH
jgi:hypothetical protein